MGNLSDLHFGSTAKPKNKIGNNNKNTVSARNTCVFALANKLHYGGCVLRAKCTVHLFGFPPVDFTVINHALRNRLKFVYCSINEAYGENGKDMNKAKQENIGKIKGSRA